MMIPLQINIREPLLPKATPASPSSSRDRNWSDNQLYRLSSFMLYHIDKFQTQRQRRESKIYTVLSRYMGNRNVNQCRNYVQKLLNKFGSYQKIIDFLQESLPLFREKYSQQSKKLQAMFFRQKVIAKYSKKMRKNDVQSLKQIQQNMVNQKIIKNRLVDYTQLKPTDISYIDQKEGKVDQINFNISDNFSLKSSIMQEKKTDKKISVLDQSYFNSHFRQKQVEILEKWMQCNQFFTQWTSKTLSLLEKYQGQYLNLNNAYY